MDIQFRPHHFLCALCFQGEGYSPLFVNNFASIMDTLKAADTTPINIVNQTDSICAPCPHRQGTQCSTEEKIAVLDRAHARALNINAHQTITWGEAKQRIASNISLDLFHQICATCNWKQYGICEKQLTTFLEEKKDVVT